MCPKRFVKLQTDLILSESEGRRPKIKWHDQNAQVKDDLRVVSKSAINIPDVIPSIEHHDSETPSTQPQPIRAQSPTSSKSRKSSGDSSRTRSSIRRQKSILKKSSDPLEIATTNTTSNDT